MEFGRTLMTSNETSFPGFDPWSACPFDERWTVAALMDWAGEKYSDRDAIWVEGQGWLNHGEIRARAARVRGALLTNLPACTRAVACLTRIGAPWYVGIQAVMTSGLAFAALEPDAPFERNRMCLDDCGAKVILADIDSEDKANALAAGKRRVVLIDEAQFQGSEFPVAQVTPESTAAFVFTSGSTGSPKAVIRSHRSIAHAMYCFAENYGYVPTDTMLFPGSPGHIGAMNCAISSMINGFRSVAIDVAEVDVIRTKQLVSAHQVSLLVITPSLLRLLLKEIGNKPFANQIRLVFTSGEAILRSDVRTFHEVFSGVELWQNYGSTETGPMAAGRYLPSDAHGVGPLPLRRNHLGCELELVDESGKKILRNGSGVVRVRSAYLSDGYLNAVPEQLSRFGCDEHGTYFMIGDRGERTENGELYIAGRGDRQFKQHGRRMELGDVEAAIMADRDWVSAVAVQTTGQIGRDDSSLVAVICPLDFEKADLLKLRRRLESRLPAAAIPRRFMLVKCMPLTASGKIDLATVARMATCFSEVAAIGHGGPPQGTCENWIADCWQFILGIDRPGREDRFQDLGGDSLAAIEFALAMEKQFGLTVSLDQLVRRPTIAQLVEEIQSGEALNREAFVSLRDDEGGPLYIMFPGVGGHAWIFSALVRAMSGPCSVRALSLSDLIDNKRGRLKDAVRAEALKISRDSINARPIILVGYSFGGLIATDTAQWLIGQGVSVSQLFLLDPSPLDSSATNWTLKGIAKQARSFVRRMGSRKSPATIQSPTAVQLEMSVQHNTDAMVRAYLNGSTVMPRILTSWLSSQEIANKQVEAKFLFGRPIESIERQQLELSHLEIMRIPGVYETAHWMDLQVDPTVWHGGPRRVFKN